MKIHLFVLLLLSIIVNVYGQRACIGYDHSCRIREDGNVVCVGENDYGQLGIRSHDPVYTIPGEKVVNLPAKAIEIHCSVYFTFVLLETKKVYGWGVNVYGQIGIGFGGFDVDYPEVAVNVPPVTTMCCGDAHCLVLAESYLDKEIFKVYGWGLNNLGQLGIGNANLIGRFSTDFPLTPACIPADIFLTSETILRCGANIGGIITRNYNYNTSDYVAQVYSWGDNKAGQLGAGNITPPNDVICDQPNETAVMMIVDGSVVDLGYGYNHSVVLLDDNTLRSAGDNEFGQLGYPGLDEVGQNSPSLPALPIATGFPVESMGSYRYHTCFSELLSNRIGKENITKRIGCYGLNIAYQLGLDNLDDNIGYDKGSMPPTTFILPGNFTFISGCVPYLNSFGFIPVNDKGKIIPLYVGWGLDNYTLQVDLEYVITPQILDTECGDKFIDSNAGEDCDNDKGTLDGSRCTARCYGGIDCNIFGSIIPFSGDNVMQYKDMFGCRKPEYNCTHISPIIDLGYCFGQNQWLVYDYLLNMEEILYLWDNYNQNMSNRLYIDGDLILINKHAINILANSAIKNQIELVIHVSGRIVLDAYWFISMESGSITLITDTPPLVIFDPQDIHLDNDVHSTIKTKQLNSSVWIINIRKDGDSSDKVIIAVFSSFFGVIFLVVIGLYIYINKIKRQSGYEPIGDAVPDITPNKTINADIKEVY